MHSTDPNLVICGTVFFGLFVIGMIVVSMTWSHDRSKKMLERWAAENGYRLLESRYVFFSFAPFYWMRAKGQTVYRIVVADRAGQQRSGMARCGTWFWGVWQDKVTVQWDS